MNEACTGECASCSVEDCADRKPDRFLEAPHELSKIKNVIGIVSGKGGVGKTMITSMLAVLMQRLGYRTAILDADVTGPSIPRTFGLEEKAGSNELGLFPAKSITGISIISTNLLLDNDTDPVVWRGPIIAGTVKRFWTDVIWDEIDYMFVDFPPGTGDVPLTVFQSIPLDGIVIVTSPQELVGMVVEKAVNMAAMMNIPILALVENMSYFNCQDCGKQHSVFGKSHVKDIAAKYGISTIAKLPIIPLLASQADKGTIEFIENDSLDGLITVLEKARSYLS